MPTYTWQPSVELRWAQYDPQTTLVLEQAWCCLETGEKKWQAIPYEYIAQSEGVR